MSMQHHPNASQDSPAPAAARDPRPFDLPAPPATPEFTLRIVVDRALPPIPLGLPGALVRVEQGTDVQFAIVPLVGVDLVEFLVAAVGIFALLKELGELPNKLLEINKADKTSKLVDNRGLGRPTVFTNDEPKFLVWACKTSNYIEAVYEEAK